MSLGGVSETNWTRLTKGLTFLTELKGHEKLALMKEKSIQLEGGNLHIEITLLDRLCYS